MENTHTRHSECGVVHHRICGTAEYVREQVERLHRDYPAAGYGTRVKHTGQDYRGATTAHVTRSASCD